MEFLIDKAWIIVTILFLVSELLGESQRFRNNSIFGLIRSFLRGEAAKEKEKLGRLLDQK